MGLLSVSCRQDETSNGRQTVSAMFGIVCRLAEAHSARIDQEPVAKGLERFQICFFLSSGGVFTEERSCDHFCLTMDI